MRLVALIFVLLAGLWPAAASADQPALDIQLNWVPVANFAGFYAAEQRGYFQREHLAVRLRHGTPPVNTIDAVTSGAASLGVASGAEIIAARCHGRKVRAIFAIYQRNPIIFFSLADKQITRPEQFAGKRIRVGLEMVGTLHAMTGMIGIPPSAYTEIFLPSDLTMVLSDRADIWGAYLNGLTARLDAKGIAYHVIVPDDYRVHGYGDVLFATDDMIARARPVLAGLLRALSDGLHWALANPAAAAQLVLRYDPNADLAEQTARATGLAALVYNGDAPLGGMTAQVWQSTLDTMVPAKPGNHAVTAEDLFSMAPLSAAAAGTAP